MKKLSIIEKGCFALIGLVIVAIGISLIPKPKEPKKLSPELQAQYEKRMAEKAAAERAHAEQQAERDQQEAETRQTAVSRKKDYGMPPPATGLNVPAFFGLSRQTLGENSAFRGEGNTIEPCLEWKKVILSFNEQGCLNSIAFIPYDPIPIQHVRTLSEQSFGVLLLDKYMFKSSLVCSFSKMPGLVRTVNCHGSKDEQGTFMVNSIGYIYNIEWRETASEGLSRARLEFAVWSAQNP